MNDPLLYEKKILRDKNFPVQLFHNRIQELVVYFEPHWHEFVELHYVVQGRVSISCSQEEYELVPGNLLIVNSNVLHTGVNLDPDSDILGLIMDYSFFSKEEEHGHVVFQPYIAQDEKIGRLFFSIFQEYSEQKIGYEMAMKGKIYELLARLQRRYAAENLTLREHIQRNRTLSRLNTILDYIEKNYPYPITNKELANLINVSEYRFCHLFKEAMRQSPTSYVNEIRLKKACNLLKEEGLTISEIAAQVGFNDFNNFGRQFRRYYGCPPSGMRFLKREKDTVAVGNNSETG